MYSRSSAFHWAFAPRPRAEAGRTAQSVARPDCFFQRLHPVKPFSCQR
ncbi:MAG: hypothetical protein AAFY63_18345 [Cyanobacteria bacterium J06643_13]